MSYMTIKKEREKWKNEILSFVCPFFNLFVTIRMIWAMGNKLDDFEKSSTFFITSNGSSSRVCHCCCDCQRERKWKRQDISGQTQLTCERWLSVEFVARKKISTWQNFEVVKLDFLLTTEKNRHFYDIQRDSFFILAPKDKLWRIS